MTIFTFMYLIFTIMYYDYIYYSGRSRRSLGGIGPGFGIGRGREYVQIYIHVCIYIYMYILIYIYIYVYKCAYVYIHNTYIYIYLSTHIHIITPGFHNFNLRIFDLRVSNPNKFIVNAFSTRCRISMC